MPLNPGNPGAPSFDSAPVAGGGGGGGGGCSFGLVVLLFAPLFFGTLYPASTLAATTAGFATNAILRATAPNLSSDGRMPFALLAAAIVFWPAMRYEHRLALRLRGYRVGRHFARVLLIGVLFSLIVINQGENGNWMPRSLAQVAALFGDQRRLIAFVVGADLAHLILSRAKGFRAWWNIALGIVGLRRMNVSGGIDDTAPFRTNS
jgi:hypothetical protein